ncbi:glycosyltransferase family 4 protein, partial [Oleiphilus sp. HI0079]|uniref:glycosyltransferase family 4 protein n=3 Tax=unclassified Oleiphilus TaxID=2631174 RepID=UPI000AC27FFF
MNKNISALVLNTFENDSRVMKEVESLGKAGYQVTIYALHEEGLKEVEQSTFYQVVRLKLWTKKWAKHKLIQLIKYLELVLRLTVLIRKSDVIHCNDLNTLPVGALIKLVRFGRVKVVYDAHEYEINQKPGQSKSSIKLLFFIESLFIRFANRVITVS